MIELHPSFLILNSLTKVCATKPFSIVWPNPLATMLIRMVREDHLAWWLSSKIYFDECGFNRTECIKKQVLQSLSLWWHYLYTWLCGYSWLWPANHNHRCVRSRDDGMSRLYRMEEHVVLAARLFSFFHLIFFFVIFFNFYILNLDTDIRYVVWITFERNMRTYG